MTRFWTHVEKTDGCWNWTGAKYKTGYGLVRVPHQRKNDAAHRMAWIITYGEIPNGLQVCHHCDNKLCCRPDHLFLGTQKDNMQDMIQKGRSPSRARESNGNSKLTRHDVDMIRARYLLGEEQRPLAIEYGVTQVNISLITLQKTWRD